MFHRIAMLAAIPLLLGLVGLLGPFVTDPSQSYGLSGAAYDVRPGVLPGAPTINPDLAATSYGLSARAIADVLSGQLPLWNYYEGLGAPLLGGLQTATFFPPALLLALPDGQLLQHIFLQLLGGFGAFLFFRRFGLSVAAAVTGAMLYELNGVFAWLRDAAFNSVAFLPWLFLTIEGVRSSVQLGGIDGRWRWIGLGALFAAFTVYAGVPEAVALYGLFLSVWAVFRLVGLTWGQRGRFVADLMIVAVLAAALSAPALVAFVAYLPDAMLAPEGGASLDAAAYLQYLMPYVYGPIAAGEDATAWSKIGGYLGVLPVIVALASLMIRDRRGTKLVLLAWIVVGLSVDPGDAAAYRHLAATWIFATIFLVALFVDRMPAMPPLMLRTLLVCGVAGGFALIILAVGANWMPLFDLWERTSASSTAVTSSFVAATVLAIALLMLSCRRDAPRAICGLLVAEAFLWFAMPYLSMPGKARFDGKAVAFLRESVGYQRVVGTDGVGIGPSFGAAWGIPTLNFQNLPVPKQTVAYVAQHLDPTAGHAFTPPLPDERARLMQFREKLPGYANAGVKYVLAAADFGARPIFTFDEVHEEAVREFAAGDVLDVAIPAAGAPDAIAGLTVLVHARARNATGTVSATLCSDADCAVAAVDVRRAQDGKPLLLVFDRTVRHRETAGYTLRLQRQDGDRRFALVTAAFKDREVPVLKTISRTEDLPAYAGPTLAAYELKNVRPYFSAPFCTVVIASRTVAEADCELPSTLTRLELSLRGWSVRVNGAPAFLETEDGAFQAVQVPMGHSRIEFAYVPAGLGTAIALAMAALMVILRMIGRGLRRRINAEDEMPAAQAA